MSWKFNPPPGWPQQPEGWMPPPGWTPDPSWPPPPAGWQFWVAADPAPTLLDHAPPAQAPPAGPYPTYASPASPPAPAYPSPASPAYPAYPAPAGPPGKPWIGRWWGIVGLVAALLVGGLIGFAGTSLALASDDEDDPDPAAAVSPGPGPPGADAGIVVVQMVEERRAP